MDTPTGDGRASLRWTPSGAVTNSPTTSNRKVEEEGSGVGLVLSASTTTCDTDAATTTSCSMESPPTNCSTSTSGVVTTASSGGSLSSNETGPREPNRNRNSNDMSSRLSEDVPLSPRYLSYRDSLASRLCSPSHDKPTVVRDEAFVASSTITATPLAVLDLSSYYSTPARSSSRTPVEAPSDEERERKRRIAAAMVSDVDDSDDDEDEAYNSDEADLVAVRQQLAARLDRNEAGSFQGKTGMVSPVDVEDDEVTAQKLIRLVEEEQRAARMMTQQQQLGDNPSTPHRTWCSVASSLSDPVSPGGTPEKSKNVDDSFLTTDTDSIIGLEQPSNKNNNIPGGGRRIPPSVRFDNTVRVHSKVKSPGDDSGEPPDPPSPLLPRSLATNRCLWLLVGGGGIMLVLALAIALVFLLTDTSDSSSSSGNNGTSAVVGQTNPNNKDPESSSSLLRRPTSTPSEAQVSATARPSAVPTTFPTTEPTAVSTGSLAPTSVQPVGFLENPESLVLLDVIVTAFASVGIDNADRNISALILEQPDTPQSQAFRWLVVTHSPEDRDELGQERLIQRYALSALFYSFSSRDRGSRNDDYYYDDVYYNEDGGDNKDNVDTRSRLPLSSSATFQKSPNSEAYILLRSEPSHPWLGPESECEWSLLHDACNEENVLTSLDLHDQRLVGTIPAELALLSRLEAIDLRENFLYGSLPTELATLSNSLTTLDLHDNDLTGSFPIEYQNLKNATLLRFDGNNLQGIIPINVCDAYATSVQPPQLYLDCGGTDPEISCPPGICCTYCCEDEESCKCVYAGTDLEEDLC